jgi:hypothetical protein
MFRVPVRMHLVGMCYVECLLHYGVLRACACVRGVPSASTFVVLSHSTGARVPCTLWTRSRLVLPVQAFLHGVLLLLIIKLYTVQPRRRKSFDPSPAPSVPPPRPYISLKLPLCLKYFLPPTSH